MVEFVSLQDTAFAIPEASRGEVNPACHHMSHRDGAARSQQDLALTKLISPPESHALPRQPGQVHGVCVRIPSAQKSHPRPGKNIATCQLVPGSSKEGPEPRIFMGQSSMAVPSSPAIELPPPITAGCRVAGAQRGLGEASRSQWKPGDPQLPRGHRSLFRIPCPLKQRATNSDA